MGKMDMAAGVQHTTLRAVVTRADGTVEDMGVIAFNHKNPFKVAKWEKETFGKVNEETAVRCAKYAAPYVASAGLLGIAGFLGVRKLL
jgi:hypothetical protein